MQYTWETSDNSEQVCTIEIVSMDEFRKDYPRLIHRNSVTGSTNHSQFCKADRLLHGVVGTFAIPPKKDPSAEKITFGYYLTDEKLLFVDDKNYVKTILDEMQEYQMTDLSSPDILFFDFMEYLVKEDVIYLQEYEKKLSTFEEALVDETAEAFELKMLASRRDIASLNAYYDQLSDMGDTLQEYEAHKGNERANVLFGLYTNKAERLYSSVQLLKEYSRQLRDMHQSQIDMRQNEIMKVLTVVTTIFMPLTLIAGWYGMNFINMPELQAVNGYPIVIVLCVITIIVEVIIFKIKKWF